MRLRLSFFLLLFLGAVRAQGAVINVPTCQAADVQAALNSANPGDHVRLPPGVCVWTLPVEWIDRPGVILEADGICLNCGKANATWSGTTTIDCRTHACFVVKNKIGAEMVRVTGIRWLNGAGTDYLIFNQSWNFRFDNNKFESTVLCQTYNIGGTQYGYYPSGVYDHNLSVNCRHLLRGDGEGGLREGWRVPSVVGTGDLQYVYTLEDNSFFFDVFGNVADLEWGSAVVYRRNYARNVYFEVHGLQPQGGADAGTYPAMNGRSWQVSDSVFECDAAHAGTGQCYAALRLRGGTGVVFNVDVKGFFDVFGIMDNPRSDNNYPGLNGPCNGLAPWDENLLLGWRCLTQIGTSTLPPGGLQPQLREPAYFWNNLFKGMPVEPIVIGTNNVKPNGSNADIVKGRDWFATPRPGYAAPPSPHPLVSGSAPAPPPPPPAPALYEIRVDGVILGSGGLPLSLQLKKNCAPQNGCKVEVRVKP